MKSLISSNTFQVAALTFTAGVLTLASTNFADYITPNVAGIILTVLGIVNTILRYKTTTPIGGIVSSEKA